MQRVITRFANSLFLFAFLFSVSIYAQTTAFTYQGNLNDGSLPANGSYDFEFTLYDALSGGSQIGSTLARANIPVIEGVFSVSLDFGDEFPGAGRWLEIRVKQSTSATAGGFTTLSPRQAVSSSPYSIKSLTAENANTANSSTIAANATQLGGVDSSQYVLTGDSRLSDARTPTAGSPDYIQNTTSQQATSNFNISGNGTADKFNALTQYNINGNRVLSTSSTSVFVGIFSGNSNSGTGNSFFGFAAGLNNTSGSSNSFFGSEAGRINATGNSNSFFGMEAGRNNTTGNSDSFFGARAGRNNTTGSSNSFFGMEAGRINTTGSSNSFFGMEAGRNNTTGNSNSFFGAISGRNSTTGINNSFFGSGSGFENTTGFDNSFFGEGSGNSNTTGNGNSFFGRNAGNKNTEGNNNSFFGYLAGEKTTTGVSNSFFGREAGLNNTTGTNNSFFGQQAGRNMGSGQANAFFGNTSGANTTTGTFNTFIGRLAGGTNTTGSSNSLLGHWADVGFEDLLNATAIGFRAQVDASNSLVLGSINGINNSAFDTNVGIGTTAPTERLHIAVNSGRILMGDAGCSSGVTAIGFASTLSGCENYAIAGTSNNTFINTPPGGSIYFRQGNTTRMRINSNGTLYLATISTAGATSLCLNATNEIGICSSSIRYKSNIENFTSGLELIKKLRPVSFNWTKGGMLDVGLVAEEVAEVEPLLTTTAEGRVEGVKYDRIGVVLVNAVKEQQLQIDKQNELILQQQETIQNQQVEIDELKKQRAEIEALKTLVCSRNEQASICKQEN